jgi:hypothetical protein
MEGDGKMAHSDQKRRTVEATPSPRSTSAAGGGEAGQGVYGSGGSYGVGGGFEDDEGRDTLPEDEDQRAARAARSEAQQEGEQSKGFERDVEPDAAPPVFPEAARTGEEEELAAKKRRGSRL